MNKYKYIILTVILLNSCQFSSKYITVKIKSMKPPVIMHAKSKIVKDRDHGFYLIDSTRRIEEFRCITPAAKSIYDTFNVNDTVIK